MLKKIYTFIFVVFLLIVPTSTAFANESGNEVQNDQVIFEEIEQTIDLLDPLTNEVELSDIEKSNQDIINNLKQNLKIRIKNESQIVSNAVATIDVTKEIKQNKKQIKQEIIRIRSSQIDVSEEDLAKLIKLSKQTINHMKTSDYAAGSVGKETKNIVKNIVNKNLSGVKRSMSQLIEAQNNRLLLLTTLNQDLEHLSYTLQTIK